MNSAAEARVKVMAAHPEATVYERRANGIIHRLANTPDGRPRYAGDYFAGPIHYNGPNWREIDTAFAPSAAPWGYEMVKADFHVYALSRLDAGQVVEYRDGGEWVRFQPMALQYSNESDQIQPIAMPESVEADVDDDTLTWADGYGPGRSLSWQAQSARLAKVLTVASSADLPEPEQFIVDGGGPVLELNLIFAYSSGVTPYINGQPWTGPMRDVDTQGLVEFRDGEGSTLWWFNLPRAWDSAGNQQLGTFRFRRAGNALYVSHRVPLSFVQSAVYPLAVDVDVDKQVAASADDGGVAYGSFSKTSPTHWIGNDSGDAGHVFARWTGVTLEGTINVSYVECYAHSPGYSAEQDVFGVDEDNPPAPNNAAQFAADPLTSASVEWDDSWTQDTWEQSPSLNAIFQELVDTYTISSEAVMVQIKDSVGYGTSGNTMRAYDYSGNAHGPKLHVEYAGAAPEGQPTMVRTRGVPTGAGSRDRPGSWN